MQANLPQAVLRYVRALVTGGPVDGHNDGALLEQFVRQHSDSAFAALLERHGPMVLSVCRGVLRDEHLAEDVFQATFLVLARKASSIRNREALASWLHGVAFRLALKLRGQTQRLEQSMNPADLPAVAAPAVTEDEEQEVVHEELQRLPERYRLPLVLCYLEGRTQNEAALQLGWSAGQLRGLLDRGRERLRSRLVRRGLTLPVAGTATLLADSMVPAAVPPLLAVSTVKAAALFAAGKTLAESGVAASVATLAEGGLHMIGSKKTILVILAVLFASMVGTGVALLASGLRQKPEQQQAQQGNPAAPAEKNNDVEPPVPPADGGQVKPVEKITRRPVLFVDDDVNIFSANCLALSADRKLLVAGGCNTYGPSHGVEVWEVSTGRRIRRFGTGPNEMVKCLALSEDARLLMSGGYANVRLCDLESGKEIRPFPTGSVNSLSLSADGKLLATAGNSDEDKVARLWDVGTAKQIREIQHDAPVSTVVLSADGKRLITGGAAIHLWQTDTGKEITLARDGDSSGPLSVSADGKWWATVPNNNGQKIAKLVEGQSVRLWDAQTGKLVRSFRNPEDLSYRSVILSPDGKWLWSYGNNQFHVPISRKWDTTSGKEVQSAAIRGSSGLMTVSADGLSFVVGRTDGALTLMDAATNKLVHSFSQPQPLMFEQMAISGDGNRLVTITEGPEPKGGVDPRARTWDLAKGRPVPVPFLKPGLLELERLAKEFPRPFYAPRPRIAVSVSRDARWLSIGGTIWDLEKETQVPRLPTPADVSAEGKKLLDRYALHPTANAFLSADNKWLVTGTEQGGVLQDVARGQVVRLFAMPGKDVANGGTPQLRATCVALSGNGKILATTHLGDWSVIVWDVSSGKEIRTLRWSGPPVWPPFQPRGRNQIPRSPALAFSPDGRWLVRGSSNAEPDGTNLPPQMWDLATGKLVGAFQGPRDDGVRDLVFTADGKRLLTLNFDRAIRVWDVATGKELCKLMTFPNDAWAVMDPAGRYDASNDGNIEGLHWTVGNETFPLSQFKDRFYDPGLLAKYLGCNREPLRRVRDEQ